MQSAHGGGYVSLEGVAMDANETAFVGRLSKAFPAVARLRSEHVRENRELLSHPFLGDVARYAISLFKSKGDVASQELRKLCSFMEKEYASGTPSVRALIALGVLGEPCRTSRTLLAHSDSPWTGAKQRNRRDVGRLAGDPCHWKLFSISRLVPDVRAYKSQPVHPRETSERATPMTPIAHASRGCNPSPERCGKPPRNTCRHRKIRGRSRPYSQSFPASCLL